MYEQKSKVYKGFAAKYNCDKLVYFQEFSDITQAIKYEKKIKKGEIGRERRNL
jgi:putative endonuclease